MKKAILSLTVVAMTALVFNSCKEDKTPEEYLTNKKGWVISKATSTPAYTNSDSVTDADLAKSWFYECELSDILTFKDDSDGKRTVLTSTCETGIKEKETTGTWKFQDKNGDVLNFRIPFFAEEEYDDVTVEQLDENNFVFSYTFIPEGKDVKHTFRISYVPGK